MLKNYLKTSLRNLAKNKFHSIVNISGLSAGISFCILILIYTFDELRYDLHHENVDRIYRVQYESDFAGRATSPAPMAAALTSNFPEIELAVRLLDQGDCLIRKQEASATNFRESSVIFSDPNIFDVFTIPFLHGNSNEALQKPNTVVISKSMADKYFQNSDPINKSLIFNNAETYTVTGVFEDMPSTSHMHFDFICSLEGVERSKLDRWLSNSFHTYVLFRSSVIEDAFKPQLYQLMEQYAGPQIMNVLSLTKDQMYESGRLDGFHLIPIKDIHLHSQLDFELEQNGNILFVGIFIAVGFFILLLACVNFINLSTARSVNRAKEVGIRKVMGGLRADLIKQFMFEFILLTAFSFVVAIILALVLLPYFNEISGKNLTMPFSSQKFWFIIIASIFIVGGSAGLYPSFSLSAYNPALVLKGRFGMLRKGTLRGTLLIFQISVSTILLVSTYALFKQINYVQKKELGYKKDQIIIIEDPSVLGNQATVFKEGSRNLPTVINVSETSYLPVTPSMRTGTGFWPSGGHPEEDMLAMQYWLVDHDYLSTLEISILKGRNFSKSISSDSIGLVINERAAELFGFENPIGQKIESFIQQAEGNKKFKIIGVVQNFHFESLSEEVNPVCFVLGKSSDYMLLKIETENISNTISQLKGLWTAINPNQPFSFSFLDDKYNRMYENEKRLGTMFLFFTVLAISISIVGLLALCAFITEQRSKEIGIRKVLGATLNNVVLLLSSEFIKLIFIALLIALPIAWVGVKIWLETYAYRTQIGVGTYILFAAGICILILLAVIFQSLKAATTNPINSLEDE